MADGGGTPEAPDEGHHGAVDARVPREGTRARSSVIPAPPARSRADGPPPSTRRRTHAPPDHPVHRPVGRPAVRGGVPARRRWGYDGLEIACWGDHFDVGRAAEDDGYVAGAARDPRAARPEGLGDLQPPRRARRSATTRSTSGTATSCPTGLGRRRPRGRAPAGRRGDEEHRAGRARKLGVDTVIGFTGSSIWKYVAMFPPVPDGDDRRRLRRTSPTAGTRSSTSSTRWACGSPTRCTRARSPTTTGRPRAHPRGDRPPRRRSASTGTRATWSGRTSTRSASSWTSPTGSTTSTARTPEAAIGNGRNGRLGSHLPWGDPRRGWDFVSTGHGDVPWEDCFRALNAIGYDGPDLGRVGGRRHGPARRRPRGPRPRPSGSATSNRRPPRSTPPSARD